MQIPECGLTLLVVVPTDIMCVACVLVCAAASLHSEKITTQAAAIFVPSHVDTPVSRSKKQQ